MRRRTNRRLYRPPPTGENLGNLSDINNPYMRRNLEFFWNFDSDQYERKEGLGETINFGGDPIPLATDIRAVLPSGFFTDYEPSIEPTTQAPTSATFEGYPHVIAADVRRGDLFSHPRRNGKFFPVNSRAEGQDDNGPFIRLEYIDIYETDQPIEWIPTGAASETDPNIIIREGFDYTPSAGLASITLDVTEWVLIKNRPTEVGKVVKLAGVPMAGTQQRYQWFFDHDVYTYNLLESMNVIGVTARFYPSDPHYTDYRGRTVPHPREQVPTRGQEGDHRTRPTEGPALPGRGRCSRRHWRPGNRRLQQGRPLGGSGPVRNPGDRPRAGAHIPGGHRRSERRNLRELLHSRRDCGRIGPATQSGRDPLLDAASRPLGED